MSDTENDVAYELVNDIQDLIRNKYGNADSQKVLEAVIILTAGWANVLNLDGAELVAIAQREIAVEKASRSSGGVAGGGSDMLN